MMIAMGSRDFRAASATAGAVFLPTGSRIIWKSSTPNCRNCSATINLCSLLLTMTGGKQFNPSSLFNVSWSKLFSLINDKNCFGYNERERGHKRVPEPPAIIIGIIILFNRLLNFLDIWAQFSFHEKFSPINFFATNAVSVYLSRFVIK